MTLALQASQAAISRLSLPLFLQNALVKAGYSQIADLEGLTVEELSGDLRIGNDVAEDILRQVEGLKAGPSRLRDRPTPTPIRSAQTLNNQLQASQTVASLLRPATRPRKDVIWSTGSRGIDELVVQPHFIQQKNEMNSDGVSSERGNALMSAAQRGNEEDFPSNRAVDGKGKQGIRAGYLMEIASPPGGGKTSLAVNVAMNARLDQEDAVEVLIVDTEGGITPARLLTQAQAMTRSPTVSPTKMLSGIHLMRLVTQAEFVAFWNTLDDWLRCHPETKLVVIDTLSYHLRQPSINGKVKKRITDLIKQRLAKASAVYGCAILVNNQMATKLLTAENKPANFDTGDRAVLMPQLGDAWIPPKTIRMLLFRDSRGCGRRFAHVQPPAGVEAREWAPFYIDTNGMLQDVNRIV